MVGEDLSERQRLIGGGRLGLAVRVIAIWVTGVSLSEWDVWGQTTIP